MYIYECTRTHSTKPRSAWRAAGLQIMNNEFGGGQVYHVSKPWVGYPGLDSKRNCSVTSREYMGESDLCTHACMNPGSLPASAHTLYHSARIGRLSTFPQGAKNAKD